MSIGIGHAFILETHKFRHDCGMEHHFTDDVTIITNRPYNLIHNNPLSGNMPPIPSFLRVSIACQSVIDASVLHEPTVIAFGFALGVKGNNNGFRFDVANVCVIAIDYRPPAKACGYL